MIYTIQCIASAFNNSVFPSALFFSSSLFLSFFGFPDVHPVVYTCLCFSWFVFDSCPGKSELVRGLLSSHDGLSDAHLLPSSSCWNCLNVQSEFHCSGSVIFMSQFFPCVSGYWHILTIPRNFWSQAFKSVWHVCPEMSGTLFPFFCECPGDTIFFSLFLLLPCYH